MVTIRESPKDKSIQMLYGEIDPIDKNFFNLIHKQVVYVVNAKGVLIRGTIRKLKDGAILPQAMKPSYIVEKDDGTILTRSDLRGRPMSFGGKDVYHFAIDRPNHEILFTSVEEYEKFKIDKIQEFAKRYNFNSLLSLAEYIITASEEYPEKFI